MEASEARLASSCRQRKEALESSLSSKVLFYDPYTRKDNTPDHS